MSRIPMTPKGAELLREELNRLQGPERAKNMKDIERAREHGDISENAEFEAAKDRQAQIEGRIMDIKGKLSSAEIIDPTKLRGDRVMFGATVTIEDLESGEESTYKIVGEDEADLREGTISVMSPIARAVMGKEEGEIVTLVAPRGNREIEIMSVEYK